MSTHTHANGGRYTLVEEGALKCAVTGNWRDATFYRDALGVLLATTSERWVDRFTPVPVADPNPWTWYYSDGTETESCTALSSTTRDEAFEDAQAEGGFGPGDVFTIVEARKAVLPPPDAESVIEQWIEQLDDHDEGFFGEDSGDWDKFPKEAQADLQVVLQAWTDRWRAHLPTVWCFGEQRNEETILLPEEAAEAVA